MCGKEESGRDRESYFEQFSVGGGRPNSFRNGNACGRGAV